MNKKRHVDPGRGPSDIYLTKESMDILPYRFLVQTIDIETLWFKPHAQQTRDIHPMLLYINVGPPSATLGQH